MSYRQNEGLIAGTQPPIEFVFRAVSDCRDMKNRLKPRVINPTQADVKPHHTELSGFTCGEWPLKKQHNCIPPMISRKDGMVAFDRAIAANSGIACLDDGVGSDNHVCIILPRYRDEDGNTTEEYLVKRDELFSLLRILWTDCEPTIEISQ